MLDAHYTLARPEVVAEQVSVDGTRKWLLRLPGETPGERPHEVECVYIPETDRGTLCLSSQVGCTLNCSFCHTGTQRLVRNLTPGEIVGQVMVARDRLGDFLGMERAEGPGLPTEGERCVSNIVMMGMGEPLYNFEAVRDAIDVVADGDGLRISKRRITLSTSGVVPMIERAGAEIGVHAGDLAACGARRAAQRAGAAQPQISDRGTARRLPQLSGRVERQAHHLRIRDAQGRQRLARRRQGAGAAARRASRPRSTSSRSIPGPARHTSARTGTRSRSSPRSCSTPAMPRRCARRAAATSSPPAASSRARPRSSPRASGMALRAMAMTD